ncbi:prolyl oligopeptidase family serine peptidase [Kordiimonas sp.]|uniref:prolyl oligopeptidase family serine peptidase n=1 Tax=Kordiimonas sp. TaxID=1970157 RepID=UPI003A8E7CDE
MKSLTVGVAMAAAITTVTFANDDPYLWLEEVEGEKALEWVNERNAHSLELLEKDARFEDLKARALKDYNAKDKIAYGRLLGGSVHNFWQDETNVRGLWRRASLKSYKSGDPKWITILDFDELAKAEDENWVYKARKCLAPDFGRCLIELSRGGGDAVVVREFDAVTKRFVDAGFKTEEAKQEVVWIDADTVLIGTDFGEGTMTDSGYANQVKIWKRNEPLAVAKLMHEGDTKDVGSFPFASHRPDGNYVGIVQAPDFFTEVIYVLDGEEEAWDQKEMRRLDLPLEINFKGFYSDMVIVQMRKDWTLGTKTVKAGTLVSIKVADALAGRSALSISEIFVPGERNSIDEVSIGKDRVFLSILDEVTGQLVSAKPGAKGWEVKNLGMPKNGSLSVVSADEWTDAAFINFESFLQPDTLYSVELGREPEAVTSLPSRFDASDMVTEQKFATSADGTKVPYFVIRHKDVPMDGSTPTILYGYGGFEISLTPGYLSGTSKLWLEEGGAYVIANIRGGGEFGPKWHQAALKANRQRAYDDFIAVGEDLVSTGLTSPAHLGIRGGSNGGLLMGVMTTQRPDLWNAVICAVPLLDMMRFHTLLAGASWMGEYGNPDVPEEKEFILEYSPYQNVKADVDYPEVFFYTSTKDDRVHPGHARKMAAKMLGMDKPVIYYENTEGGHSAAANLKQKAFTDALQIVYALKKLKD